MKTKLFKIPDLQIPVENGFVFLPREQIFRINEHSSSFSGRAYYIIETTNFPVKYDLTDAGDDANLFIYQQLHAEEIEK